jgi:hypothetical protein
VPLPGRRSAVRAWPTAWVMSAAAALAAAVIVAMLFWYPGHTTTPTPSPVETTQKFDAAVIPLLADADRRYMAAYYPAQPDPKALAITIEGAWGVSAGVADLEVAKREAVERCNATAKRYKCKIYAAGRNVVWQAASPLLSSSSDLRTEPLDSPFSLQELQFINGRIQREIADDYPPRPDHKALAIRPGGLGWWGFGFSNRAEAARMIVERCSEFFQTACLVIAVDGFMTVQVPRLHRPIDVFMIANEVEMSDQDKRRIGKIYEQKEWRALVRAKSGNWYAVANAASEAAAVEAALASCAQSERDCRLYAIGNFRVADGQDPGPATNPAPVAVESTPRFDASVVPLLGDSDRRYLAAYYPGQPDPKALAITIEGAWGVSAGVADLESAKREAVERCNAKAKRYKCKIYATGRNVVWQASSPSRLLSPDIHTEPLDSPFSLPELQFINERIRKGIVDGYPPIREHKALALTRTGLAWWGNGIDNRTEAARITVERCSEFYQTACLLIAVDGFMTVQIPKLHRPVDFFLISDEPGMSDQDKQRIGKVYEQKEWRALVRAKSGSWYAVANAESETAAVEAALASCAQSDSDCRLHAIGNFRVADEK